MSYRLALWAQLAGSPLPHVSSEWARADTVDLGGDLSPLGTASFLLSRGAWPKVGPLASGCPREVGVLFCSLSYPWATDEDTSPLDSQHLPLELQAFGADKPGSYSIQEASKAVAWHSFPASVPLLVLSSLPTHSWSSVDIIVAPFSEVPLFVPVAQ